MTPLGAHEAVRNRVCELYKDDYWRRALPCSVVNLPITTDHICIQSRQQFCPTVCERIFQDAPSFSSTPSEYNDRECRFALALLAAAPVPVTVMPIVPFRVGLEVVGKCHGLYYWGDRRIEVAQDLPPWRLAYVLLHEYAHHYVASASVETPNWFIGEYIPARVAATVWGWQLDRMIGCELAFLILGHALYEDLLPQLDDLALRCARRIINRIEETRII